MIARTAIESGYRYPRAYLEQDEYRGLAVVQHLTLEARQEASVLRSC